jgi:hypothetical protein
MSYRLFMPTGLRPHDHSDASEGTADINPDSIGVTDAVASYFGNNMNLTGDLSLANLYAEAYSMDHLDANSISGNTNNWTVDGGSNWPNLTPRWDVRVQAGTWDLTGIVAPASAPINRPIFFSTVGMTGTLSVGSLTLRHNVTSTAANRFYLPNAASIVIPPQGGWVMVYNNVVNRWIVIAYAGVAGVTAHSALTGLTTGDDHTQYRLESADHSHASAGLQGGTVSHDVLTGVSADDHHNESHALSSHTGLNFSALTRTVIRPSISANQNNWAPTGIVPECIIQPNLNSANRTITGIDSTGFADGDMLYLQCGGANSMLLSHLSGSSSAANQIRCPGAATYTITDRAGVTLWYNASDALWNILDK